MAAQADGLLVHGHLVGKDGGLGEDAAFVNGRIRQDLLELCLQTRPVVRHRLGAARLHLGNQRQDGLPPAAQVLGQSCPLGRAHGIEGSQRLFRNAQEVRKQLRLIHLGLVQQEYIRQAREHGNGDLSRHAVVRLQLLQRRQIPFHHGLIQAHGGILGPLAAHGDEHIYLAPGNGGLYSLLHGILAEGQPSGQLHRAVQIPIVDTAHLHGEFPAVYRFYGTAIAGHAFNHGHDLLLFPRRAFCGDKLIPRRSLRTQAPSSPCPGHCIHRSGSPLPGRWRFPPLHR